MGDLRVRALTLIVAGVLALGMAGPGPAEPPTNPLAAGAGPAEGRAPSSPVQASAARVPVSAKATRKANGRVRVVVTSRAKVVQVKYRTASGKKKLRTKRTHGRTAVFSLSKSARKVYVRARSARTQPGKGWQAVRVPALTARQPATKVPLLGTPTAAQLREVRKTRVFFGHQSVGANILGGFPTVYASGSVAPPAIVDGRPPASGGVGNAYIGANFDPRSKLRDFSTWVRSRGVGNASHVALMKLCYVDVTAGFDVTGWFREYRSTLKALQVAYPAVTFLHVTAPLTTYSSADNVTRYKLNSLLRKEYGSSGRLIDLAALESTKPNGQRVTGRLNGQAYEQLYEGYSSDGGHLNGAGASRAASLVVRVIATAR